MEAIEKLREVAIEAVEHVAMANYASREAEALKMIDDCVDSIRAEQQVIPFSIGDRCIRASTEILIIDSLPDELNRITYSIENSGAGGHMGVNHWRKLKKV